MEINSAQVQEIEPAQAEPQEPRSLTVAGNDLRIYVEFPPLLKDMLEDLQTAKKRIWVEVYIFAAGAAGEAIAKVLKEKAADGVDVRVLYDALGSQSTAAGFFTEMAKAGVKLHAFHSLAEALYRLRFFSIMNRRNHRKIMVIDDRVGYFGGMNLIDSTQAAVKSMPMSAGWRDVHIRLAGPQQRELAESLERSWARAHKQTISCRSWAYRRALLEKRADGSAQEYIRFFDSGPGRRYSRAARVFTRLLNRAQKEVTLSMAYFLPVGRVLRALLAAKKRAVRIRVIVPGKSDVRLVQRATTYLYDMLLKRRFRVYERKERMLHSKVMLVDNTWTVVGSCNFDPRSLWINLEFLAVIRSARFAEQIRAICCYEIEHSQRITPPAMGRLWWHDRILNRMAWWVRWWL